MIALVARPCPLCGSSENDEVFTDVNRREGLAASGTLVTCRRCAMQYLSPAPSAADLGRLYEDGSVDPVSFDVEAVEAASRRPAPVSLTRRVARAINGALRAHPHDWPEEDGRGGTIFDFGCHTGNKLLYWYQRGWQVAGLDLNTKAIEVARRRFPEGEFWCGDLLQLEIGRRFDVIRSDNVIEHLFDPVRYLSALAALLLPGGRLRVFVPNGGALSVRLFGRYSCVYWMPFHLNLFSPATLRAAMEQAGLRQVECQTFTPVGSWVHTERQFLLKPGFNRGEPSRLDRIVQAASLLNYPGETASQWIGLGEELIATGQRPAA